MSSKRTLPVDQPGVGKLIYRIRQKTQLTQEKFAAKLGVTHLTVNRWENGHSKPSPLALQKLEELIQQLSVEGEDLLAKYFSEE
ncbi:DNA-binding transcriptional regulator [Leptolyngbya sp. FACHB-261]|uniref:helix-turn-helix domain-containing protein n=1 Tax=Leptolyngbya sp. FACHB-261 TaxID=2692806 RepID=UPI0016880BBB|nr:helix-turn-helix transcriptional regulator [Leptolyngbya sp. FACHB-261]MBD2102485.1 helix-turn-helix transcriptional regulator [Leptolyngbya sp. FACHB-261]